MPVLKVRPEDTSKQFKVKLDELLVAEIEEITKLANDAGADFPVDEIVESALKKAVKKARSELDNLKGNPSSVTPMSKATQSA
ncbi:hypothetical protein [Teredinibacter turnerae]|uniref:hypothetical protein n=1 Tax=Teredinibacter turnerae TaxID=2426 RepID=UPI00036D1E55|nr:hypothetical protein [Teredinibacter turnerae]